MSPRRARVRAIRRIVVTLDGSGQSLAALDAAATLAAYLQAELEALFIEDLDSLRLADLPGARLVSNLWEESHCTDRQRMERRLHVRAARAQESLRSRAAAFGIPATFRLVRGEPAAEMSAAASAADLLSVGKAGPASVAGDAHTAAALGAALATGRPLLLVGSQPRFGYGVLVAHDGSASAWQALALAADLASRARQPLRVLVLGGSPASVEALVIGAKEEVADLELGLNWLFRDDATAAAVVAAVQRERPALLVLGLPAEGVGRERAAQVLEKVGCPLLLVP